ncbi:MAG: galactose mutarotase [Dysgonamonadaceae bacterium]|jgi:aldose 1-epimerase|nr:galactose mutarotase [Dysgonamonadaceae bacterium]
MMKAVNFILIMAAFMIVSCGDKKDARITASARLSSAKFQATSDDGRIMGLYTIRNELGMEVAVTNIGGRIVSIWVPDKDGGFRDVVLGFDNAKDYERYAVSTNFGAIIGRYGNRIENATMTLRNNATYNKLRPNDNAKNTLHGGPRGFHARYFNIEQPSGDTLVCKYKSANMEEGFPGEMLVTVTYSVSKDNELRIDYKAETNVTSVCNLTNHSYFNLSGDPKNTILDHILYINADAYTPTNIELIPTGKIDKVKGTPLDFTAPTVIGERIEDVSFEAIKFGKGYDHNYVLNNSGNINTLAAKVSCPSTGIGMEVYTTEPGIQFYSGNFLDGTNIGKNGISYERRAALCLETQHFPNSPNIRHFPNTEIYPGETYRTTTIYKFTVND